MALLLAATLVAALHASNLFFAGPLWRDEVGDAVYAALPSWGRIWALLKYDNFPPGLLVLLRTWRALGLQNLGGPDFGYRIYGLLIGLAIPAALWLNARWLGGRRNAPWFSLSLFAAGGFVVRVSDSVRPYGPGWLLMLLGFGLVWRVVQSPRPGRIAAAAAVAVLSVQSLYQDAFVLFAFGTMGMIVAARAGRWRAVAAVAGIGALAAMSLVPYALGPVHEANAWSMVSRPGLGWLTMAGLLWLAAGSLAGAVSWLWVAAVAGVVWAALTLPPGTNAEDVSAPDARWYAAGSVLIVFPLYLGFLKALGMMTTPWYYLLPLALAANALDVLGAVMSRDARWRGARLAFLAVALGVSLTFGWRLVQVRVTNADRVAAQVGALARPGDLVLVEPWPYGVSFQYYYRGQVPWTTLPPLADHTIHRYDLVKDSLAAPEGIAPVLAQMGATLRAGHRVWMVGQINSPPVGRSAPVLRPAPNDPRAGWDESVYEAVWMLQTGEFLRAHAARAVDVPSHLEQPVSFLEEMRLGCVEGWKP